MKDVMEMDARGVSDFFATTGINAWAKAHEGIRELTKLAPKNDANSALSDAAFHAITRLHEAVKEVKRGE
jgi:hypothetical protein